MGDTWYDRKRSRIEVWHVRYEIDPETGCWNWLGYLQPKGYGLFWADGQVHLAHRWGYRALVGDFDDHLTIDHLCRNKACVNPAHLEVVPAAVNTQRSFPRSQVLPSTCPSGHEFTPENTSINNRGSRVCKKCQAIGQRARMNRKRAEKGQPPYIAPTPELCKNGHVGARNAAGKCRECLRAADVRFRERRRAA